ncbi:hypothetical protein niasHT_007373 [Heterodera trifolii]|uniref:General transcription factor IIH subunit 3 n=1 Tax=Heterodera trifolii TaxID=157864 RepID=A0ABD2LLG6_9BILA
MNGGGSNNSFLCVIFDCNAYNWGCVVAERGVSTLNETVSALIALCNAHNFSSLGNRLLLLAKGAKQQEKKLFTNERITAKELTNFGPAIEEIIHQILAKNVSAEESPSNLSSALSLSICAFQRFKKQFPSSFGHVVFINLSEEFTSEQNALLNLFFASRQYSLHFHVASFHKTVPILQQASDITGGSYMYIDNAKLLAHKLLCHCICGYQNGPSPFGRSVSRDIDYRAKCHCHDQLIDIGWTCSVCLAITCNCVPFCKICNAVFPRPSAPNMNVSDEEIRFSRTVRHLNQRLFFGLLSQFSGNIAIVWDGKAMTTQFDMIVTPKLLQEHNVTKNYKLELVAQPDTQHVVYLIYATRQSVLLLLRNWLHQLPDDDLRLHHVVFIPDASLTLRQQLREDQRVWDRLQSVDSLPLHWFPTEQHKLLTMELPQLVAQLVLNGDWNFLFRCATAIRQLEQLITGSDGALTMRCKGEWSARILDMCRKIRDDPNEKKLPLETDFFPSIHGLRAVTEIVVVDRWVDPLSPMLQQLTFGGACDELLAIDSKGRLRVPLADFEEREDQTETAQQSDSEELKELNLHDKVYEQLQDLHVNQVANKIRVVVNELKEEEQQREKLASLAEYKKFVSKLPSIVEKRKSVGNFTRLAGLLQRRLIDEFFTGILRCEQDILKNAQPDKVIPFIENAIIERRDKVSILRLIAIQSMYSKGLKPFVLHSYAKLLVQTYGFSILKWLLKLQIAGIIRDDFSESKIEVRYPTPNFGQIAGRIYGKNYVEVDELRRTGQIRGVSLIVRLIEEGPRTNWAEFTTVGPKNANMSTSHSSANITDHKNGKSDQLTLVFVVGGLTRSEMSMLNQLSNILCCTSSLINGGTFLNSLS